MLENECPICSQEAERSCESGRGSVVFWYNCSTCGIFAFEMTVLQQYREIVLMPVNQVALKEAIREAADQGREPLVFDTGNIQDYLAEL